MNFKDHKIAIQFSKQSGIRKIDLSDIHDIKNCYKNNSFLTIISLLSDLEKIYSVLDNKTIFNQLQKEINIMNKQYKFSAYSNSTISVNGFFHEVLKRKSYIEKKSYCVIKEYDIELSKTDIEFAKKFNDISNRSGDFSFLFINEKEYNDFVDKLESYYAGYENFEVMDSFIYDIRNSFESI